MWGGWLRWFWHRASFLIHNFGVTPPPSLTTCPPRSAAPSVNSTQMNRNRNYFSPQTKYSCIQMSITSILLRNPFRRDLHFLNSTNVFSHQQTSRSARAGQCCRIGPKGSNSGSNSGSRCQQCKATISKLTKLRLIFVLFDPKHFSRLIFFRTVNFFFCKWLNFENSISIDWFDAKKTSVVGKKNFFNRIKICEKKLFWKRSQKSFRILL